MSENPIKVAWREDRPTFGGWCTIPSAFSAELLARQGFDWVCVDLQHGLAGPDALTPMLQAIEITKVPPIVRLPWNDPAWIGRALDAGALGVIIPMVNSRAEAEAAVAACRYAPAGARSFGPIRAALSHPYTVEWANENILCIVMIETRQAVEQVDEILSVPGIDAAYVGPADLSVSLGLPPLLDVRDPTFVEARERILEACRRNGIAAGMHTGAPEFAAEMAGLGFRFLALATDAVYLGVSANRWLTTARSGVPTGSEQAASRPYA